MSCAEIEGAKEQGKIKIAINEHCNNDLKATWIDVVKAYDNIDQGCFLECIKILISYYRYLISSTPQIRSGKLTYDMKAKTEYGNRWKRHTARL